MLGMDGGLLLRQHVQEHSQLADHGASEPATITSTRTRALLISNYRQFCFLTHRMSFACAVPHSGRAGPDHDVHGHQEGHLS